MFEIIFADNQGKIGKTLHVVACDFDEALRKCKEAGYDYSTYNKYGTEDIISFRKLDNPDVETVR